MLQRLAQFCIALFNLLEQPHIFDGDDGLVGKGFEKIDLLIGERTDFGPANADATNCNSFSQQWGIKHCASAGHLLRDSRLWIFRLNFSGNIMDVN
jgi:hypothetical protein